MNPYFELAEPKVIADIESLLSLNMKKEYYLPGDQTRITDDLSGFSIPHTTAGIFRGQLLDWPLIPKCYREMNDLNTEIDELKRWSRWRQATYKFRRFCERAEVQTISFPLHVSDRMSIAQHFGVPTPLLDWTQSIFAAIFFAIRDVYENPEFEKSYEVFVYHIVIWTNGSIIRSSLHHLFQICNFQCLLLDSSSGPTPITSLKLVQFDLLSMLMNFNSFYFGQH
jgi:hypothetical protein